MNLKLTVAILAIAVASSCAQAQQPGGAKVTADAQNVVKIISGDKTKTQTYCQLDELSDQITQALQKKDNKKAEELSRKMDELEGRLGPEFRRARTACGVSASVAATRGPSSPP
jgi:hypothetical protein